MNRSKPPPPPSSAPPKLLDVTVTPLRFPADARAGDVIATVLVETSGTAFSGTLEAKNLITRKTGNGVLTINRLTYTALAGAPTSLMVCFEIAPAVKEHA